MSGFSIFPPRASSIAGEIDGLYAFLVAITVGMCALIFFCVALFAIKYRRRRGDPMPKPIHGSLSIELFWSITPFFVMLVMFLWGTKLYFQTYTPPPANTLDVYVTGKQWMWKVQHPGGQREINELHVPVGRAIKIILASEDVIHSFFVPAFRVKHDAVPGSFQTFWFEATKPGRYHLFCAEYCGTNHSEMGGWVTVMEPADYESWLAGGSKSVSMAEQGRQLFSQYGCASCHLLDQAGRCPTLRYIYGKPVQLEGGRTVVADEAYLRESILNPNAKIVSGYARDIMPVFQGQISEEGLVELIVYIKSLTPPASASTKPGAKQPEPARPNPAKASPK